MLSHFRACGGRLVYQQRPIIDEMNNKLNTTENENDVEKQDTKLQPTLIDVLELDNHQRLAVLFCSFSTESNNAPAFCVDPW